MSMSIDSRVKALSNEQAVAACDALILLLAERLRKTADAEDYQKIIETGGRAEQELRLSLADGRASTEQVAGTAKTMLLLVADLGYADLVDAALVEGETHVRDLGLVSGALILGALAAVVGWIPTEQTTKTVTRRIQQPDGSSVEEQVTEHYTKRAGVEAVKAFGSWVKVLVNLP
jgi:hypothetical protein